MSSARNSAHQSREGSPSGFTVEKRVRFPNLGNPYLRYGLVGGAGYLIGRYRQPLYNNVVKPSWDYFKRVGTAVYSVPIKNPNNVKSDDIHRDSQKGKKL